MITRAHRFHGYGSLNHTYSHGRSVRGQSLTLKYCKNPKRTDYRLAVVVSKKVHKSAVTRNRIRRRIYEIIRKKTDLKSAYDMIISVYDEGAATCNTDKLESQAIALIDKAGIS